MINKSKRRNGIRKEVVFPKNVCPLKSTQAIIAVYIKAPMAFIKLLKRYSDFFMIILYINNLKSSNVDRARIELASPGCKPGALPLS